MTYSLQPSAELIAARRKHRAYEICEIHDAQGRAEVTAVLRAEHAGQGLPVLVSASTVPDLVAELAEAGPPGLPQRQRNTGRPYFVPQATAAL